MSRTRLSNFTWIELERVARDARLGIIPVGAIEPYGPHLPVSTDGIVAEWIALQVAERCGGVVTPLVFVGNSALFSDFPGTMTIDDVVLYQILAGVAQGLHSAGFTELLVINGHAGNSSVINRYLTHEAVQLFHRVLQIDVWRLAESLGQDLFAGIIGAFTHAGPCATAVMLAIAPDLVRKEALQTAEQVTPIWLPGTYLPILFRKLYPKAYAGDIQRANPEAGKLLLERIVNYVVKAIQKADVH